MDKNNERIEKFRTLDSKLQELYSSPQAGATMYNVSTKFDVSEENYTVYAEIVGDTILGFNRITDMPRLFQQKLGLSADEAQRMTSQLIDFLEPVVRREEQEATMKKEELATLQQTFAKPENLGQQNPQAETGSPTVEPIRTMEQDVNRVHGYGAYVAARDGEEGEGGENVKE